MTSPDTQLFDGLVAVVQYRGKDGLRPYEWRTMAAFDVKSLAESYAKGCVEGHRAWQYRVVEVGSK